MLCLFRYAHMGAFAIECLCQATDREQIHSRINNNWCRAFQPRRPLSTVYKTVNGTHYTLSLVCVHQPRASLRLHCVCIIMHHVVSQYCTCGILHAIGCCYTHSYRMNLSRANAKQNQLTDCRIFRPCRLLPTVYKMFCTKLTKAYGADTSCNHCYWFCYAFA